tara:strand:+ start:98097 stop:98465 length:369 start_codon:yes stop_codon:yes gene_type:complete
LKKLTLLFILISGFCSAQEAEIFFEQDFQKLGKVTEGDQVKIKYAFTNTGTEPLFITKHTVPCVCTRVRFPLKPIAPMATDTVYVYFDSEEKKGIQDRTITLYSNAKNSPTKIRFRLTVKKK